MEGQTGQEQDKMFQLQHLWSLRLRVWQTSTKERTLSRSKSSTASWRRTGIAVEAIWANKDKPYELVNNSYKDCEMDAIWAGNKLPEGQTRKPKGAVISGGIWAQKGHTGWINVFAIRVWRSCFSSRHAIRVAEELIDNIELRGRLLEFNSIFLCLIIYLDLFR